jgi:hypothetical protein
LERRNQGVALADVKTADGALHVHAG